MLKVRQRKERMPLSELVRTAEAKHSAHLPITERPESPKQLSEQSVTVERSC